MDPVRRATLLRSRESRNGTNDEPLTMVEREVLDRSGARKTGNDNPEQQTDPITAPIASKPVV